ncbi:MAG: dynamin [Actinobacteria bacterium]|nr:dynamin [Actinomycetota bacterium]MBI3687322.1 dynamin [Actinomycetota bacterium]
MTPGSGGLPLELMRQVTAATAAALDVLAEQAPGEAGELRRVAARSWSTPTVVVAGEVKRGKSSLVNALLAAPGLSPVNAELVSGCAVRFRHGPLVEARALPVGGAAALPVPVPVAGLADVVFTPGEQQDQPAQPRLIEVAHPSPMLAGLSLVDAPGFGGLVDAPGELALAAVRDAAALLFVADASGPLGDPELTFLRVASEAVELVVVALTKIDVFRGWREVLAEDRALLAGLAPRLATADILPVSARLAERAVAATAPELTALLHTEARVAELRRLLRTSVAAQAEQLRGANTLRTARTLLTTLDHRLLAEREVLAVERGGIEGWHAERQALAGARRAGGRSWQVRLRAEIQRARLETMTEVQQEIRDQAQHWRVRIDRADQPALDRLPAELDAVIRVLSRHHIERMLARLCGVTDAVLGELFVPEAVAEVYAGFARSPGWSASLATPERRARSPEDRVVALGGVMAGFGAGRLVALVPAMAGAGLAAAVTLPVSVGLGLAAST